MNNSSNDVEITTEQARKRVKELFSGEVLDSWIESARTIPLTEFKKEKTSNPGNRGPRPTCTDCAKKHLSQSAILLSESKRGYPDHIWLALGHMAEAEEELVGEYPDHANTIREERKRVESSKGEYSPDYLGLIKTVDSECKGCKLNSNPSHNPNSTMLGANGSGNPGKVLNSPEYVKFIEKNNIKEKGECGTCDRVLTTLKNKYGKDKVRTNMVTRIMSVGSGIGLGGGLGWVVTRIGKEIDIRWKDAAGVPRINKPVEVQVRTWLDIAKAIGATVGLLGLPKYTPENSIQYFALIGLGAEGLSRTADHAEAVIDKMVGVTYVPYRSQTPTAPSPYPPILAQGQPGQVIIQASPEMMSVS